MLNTVDSLQSKYLLGVVHLLLIEWKNDQNFIRAYCFFLSAALNIRIGFYENNRPTLITRHV